MGTELSISTGQMVALTDTEMIKPLIREIHLFDTYIAGTTRLEDGSVLQDLPEGMRLDLRREENKFDSNTILVLDEQGRKMGYVPEKDNIIFARLMDAGKRLTARVTRTEQHSSFTKIVIGICLVDF